MLTDNLSTAIIVMAITVLLLFLVHPKTKRFVVFACVVLVLAVIVVVYLKIQISDMATSTDFRMRRIIAWLNPEANSDKDSYQFLQGLYAIGSGGFFGKGLGNSTQKLSAIPEAQNDMILTVICEELGSIRSDPDPLSVWIHALPADVYCKKCTGSLWISDRSGHLFAYCSAGDLKYCSRDRSDPYHRSYTSIYQLRRYSSRLPFSRDGDCTWDLIKNRIKRLKPLSGNLKKYQRRCLLGAGSVSDILNKRL